MSAHSKLPDEPSKLAKNMCHSSDFRGTSWRQQSSNATNEKLPSSKRQECSRFLDKSEESGPFAQPYINQHNKSRRETDDEHVLKLNSGRFQKQQVCSKVNTETDIVRHMKNLPSYLHPVEKPKNVQDRALNVGVLDWKRLEKWSDNERLPRKGDSRASSRFNSLSMANETSAPSKLLREKKHRSVDLTIKPLPEETQSKYAQHSQEKAKNVRDSQYSTELPQKMKLSSSSHEVKNDKGKMVDRNQKITLQNEVPFRQGEKSRHDDCVKLCPEHPTDEPQDIVLLVPKVSRKSSSKNHHLIESKRSLDGTSVEKNQKSHSCRYSPQDLLLPGEYPDEIDMKNSNVDSFEEKTAVKSRPQSPGHRFSFNLGKIGRSFSFRESSIVSKDNSKYVDAKSGPIISESLSGIVNNDREKSHSSNIGWSSSFRKVLNPVLKPKPAHSTQESHSNFVGPETTNANKLPRDASNFQALVQLHFKNRLPFFRFVAGNSSDILTASIKDLPTIMTGGKFSYSFHSVTEVKKKSTSWMIGHGRSKEKKCSFDHTDLCQMKISVSRSSNTFIEYVLYGVRVGDPEVSLNKEIAAIILKQPSSTLAYYGSEPEEWKNIESNLFFSTLTTVILPGAIHGMPKEGAPSSLMDRWKSGGVCDCEGWDMGCKLRVLIDQKEGAESLSSTNVCSLIEEGEGRKQTMFSMSPFKDGYYSVHFDTSISQLEAFAICVAVLTSERLSDILDPNLLVERNLSVNEKKTEKPLVKYFSSPPTSPADRI